VFFKNIFQALFNKKEILTFNYKYGIIGSQDDISSAKNKYDKGGNSL